MRRLLLSHYNTKSLIQTSLAPCMGDGMVRITTQVTQTDFHLRVL